MLSLKVTGSIRDIANSAWISTTSEIKTKTKTDEDVDRVVKFLATNMHTSPFECVTLTFISKDKKIFKPFKNISFFKFSEVSGVCYLTTDLLNFSKTFFFRSKDSQIWKLFEKQEKEMADAVGLFNFSMKYDPPSSVDGQIDTNQMKVELISYHDSEVEDHSRATWRIKCPLSIAVQILRHRTGSFNMVSGRYKTIRQEIFELPNDIEKIIDSLHQRGLDLDLDELSSLGILVDDMSYKMKSSKAKYLEMMKELKRCKTEKIMTNDEYKRMREYVRFVLPEGRMTELYVTFYMNDFRNFLLLRNSSHAQVEHIWIAQQMEKLVESYKKN